MIFTNAELEANIANDINDAWEGAGCYDILFSDGSKWTNEGAIYCELEDDLAENLRCAYMDATETSLPYAELAE